MTTLEEFIEKHPDSNIARLPMNSLDYRLLDAVGREIAKARGGEELLAICASLANIFITYLLCLVGDDKDRAREIGIDLISHAIRILEGYSE